MNKIGYYRENKGFSLIELMIVVAILGILVAVALPQFASMTNDAKISKVKEYLRTLTDAVIRYRNSENGEPETLKNLVPRYMASLPSDPWGSQFYLDAKHFAVCSPGEDGLMRTLDDYKTIYDLDSNRLVKDDYKKKLENMSGKDLFINTEKEIDSYFADNKDNYMVMIFTNSFDGRSPKFLDEVIASGHIGTLINPEYFKVFIADFSKNVFMFSKYGIKDTPSVYVIDSRFMPKGSPIKDYKSKEDFTAKFNELVSSLE
ncbi:prepilin-type N-terminal cleavage/methylation domain-containing protein [bacterium]|nr:prepilin-type N-terminal cleavage/methylation domain-containing protein [bacterium]